MKTVGRILILLSVFALIMGVTYWIVSSRSSNPGMGPGVRDGQWKVCSTGGSAGCFGRCKARFPRQGTERLSWRTRRRVDVWSNQKYYDHWRDHSPDRRPKVMAAKKKKGSADHSGIKNRKRHS